MPENTVSAALDRFIQRQSAQQPNLPLAIYDSKWPSECYYPSENTPLKDGERVAWKPVLQSGNNSLFERIAEALETEIHPDIISYYSRYWSDPLPARAPEGELSLLLVWNEDDMERLRGNLIGHALQLRKQKQPLTFFFACTEPDGEYFLSIDNQTGEVLLEQPGRKPLRNLADSLADYLDTLEPLTISDME